MKCETSFPTVQSSVIELLYIDSHNFSLIGFYRISRDVAVSIISFNVTLWSLGVVQ